MVILRKINLLVIILILGLISCKEKKENKFKIPKIISENTYDSILFTTTNILESGNPIFFDKYLFKNKIYLNNQTRHSKEFHNDLFRLDIINYSKQQTIQDSIRFDGLQLIFDSTIIRYNKYNELNKKGIFNYNTKKYGFEYYPLYVINETKKNKLLDGKDGYVYCIQEAQDSNQRWYPIENLVSDFCGNGTWNLLLNKNEFALILIPKYTGNYKTKIRVRLKNNNCVYTSNIINGYINYSQFYLDKEKLKYYSKYNDKSIIGSIPKDYSN